MPMDHLASGEMDRLVQGLLARRLPSFAFAGERDVARGLMASLNVDAPSPASPRVSTPSDLTFPLAKEKGQSLVGDKGTISWVCDCSAGFLGSVAEGGLMG